MSNVKPIRLGTRIEFYVCCLVLALGIRHVALSFCENVDHPGYDFFLRRCEVVCLTALHTDPFDVFSGKVQDDRFRPYHLGCAREQGALEWYWVIGYPPWEYTLVLPSAWISLRVADAIYKGLELFALASLLCFSFFRIRRLRAPPWRHLLAAGSVCLLSPTAWNFVFLYGNWSLLFCAGVVGLVLCLERNRHVWAGFVLAFLMVKPQQGIWFVIPLLLRRRFKTIVVAVVTCLFSSIPPSIFCGKSPLDLILEIPKFRPADLIVETSLFSPEVFRWMDDTLFPKAALVLGLFVCMLVCLFFSWENRHEHDWFVYFQPTFFCICAGFPLWRQDWLYYYFSVLFLLEIWISKNNVSTGIRFTGILTVVLLANPLSWMQFDLSLFHVGLVRDTDCLRLGTWMLFAILVACFFLRNRRHDCFESDCLLPTSDNTSGMQLTHGEDVAS